MACGDDFNSRMRDKPSAFGPLNQINVVADEPLWNDLKDSFAYYFEAPYPLLPQPEPIFDVRQFSPSDLIAKRARKHLRTYVVLATTEDTTSQTFQIIKRDLRTFDENLGESGYEIKVAKDKWANNQILVYIYAETKGDLIDAFSTQYDRIIKQIRAFGKQSLSKQVYIGGTNKVISEILIDSFDLSIKLPQNAKIALINEDLAWIRMETKESSSSILVSKMPYDSAAQLYKKGIIEIRNQLTKEHIEGPRPGTYPIINEENLPVLYDKIKLAGNDAYEIRGLWEMVGAYMGGPFVTHMVLGPNLESLYLVDVFVYAPGEEKRELLQKLEYMASTITIVPKG
jgi:hypothetical protein